MEASMLLSGSRGRRLLLEYALESQRLADPDFREPTLFNAVRLTSYDLDPGKGTSRVMMAIGEGESERESFTPDDVAALLGTVELLDVTPEILRKVLKGAVDSAHAYQEPDGEDVLASTSPVVAALHRFAEHITDSSQTDWWTSPADLGDQWILHWQAEHAVQVTTDARATIAEWRQQAPEIERWALQNRPTDPTENWSGEWWSIPPPILAHSARRLHDGCPAGIWFAEDAGGEDKFTAERVEVPGDIRVYEIDGAAAWAELCQRFPLDVSGQKRHDWYRATGRHGKWVIPDWSLVAREYDGVHLTVAGYLSASNIEIPVDDVYSSVIAAWNPDETWWFIDPVWTGEMSRWVMEANWSGQSWVLQRDVDTRG